MIPSRVSNFLSTPSGAAGAGAAGGLITGAGLERATSPNRSSLTSPETAPVETVADSAVTEPTAIQKLKGMISKGVGHVRENPGMSLGIAGAGLGVGALLATLLRRNRSRRR